MLACLIDQLRPQSAVLPINLSRGYERLVEQGDGALEMSRTGLSNVAIKAADIGPTSPHSPTAATSSQPSCRHRTAL